MFVLNIANYIAKTEMLRENLQLQSQIGGMLVNQVYRRSQLKY
jgi:hypothetical protein